MPRKRLTATFVAGVKATGRRVEYFDRHLPGLVLRVTPNGVKSWCVALSPPAAAAAPHHRHRGCLLAGRGARGGARTAA
jgi:hypothetical protein